MGKDVGERKKVVQIFQRIFAGRDVQHRTKRGRGKSYGKASGLEGKGVLKGGNSGKEWINAKPSVRRGKGFRSSSFPEGEGGV